MVIHVEENHEHAFHVASNDAPMINVGRLVLGMLVDSEARNNIVRNRMRMGRDHKKVCNPLLHQVEKPETYGSDQSPHHKWQFRV